MMTAGRKWSAKRGEGQGIKFLRENVGYSGDDCLIWPLSRQPSGYGSFGYLGKQHYTHRFMCELVHGPAPTPAHQAAHSCGRGKDGCVHPKHLSWKTLSGNMLDKRLHGTERRKGVQRAKLTEAQVAQIRAPADRVNLVPDLAAQFGVTESNIRHIRSGRSWKSGTKWAKKFTDDEVEAIKSSPKKEAELAVIYGVSRSTIYRIRDGITYKREVVL